jgi:Tol biopolymer transport system component
VLAAFALVRASRPDRVPIHASDLLPIVTWPGKDFDGRLSPDAQWVSFVARHDGRYGLWLRKVSMPEPRLVHESAATIESHVWSTDGERIALLLEEHNGAYLRCMPSQGGPMVWSQQLGPDFADAYLVRWIGSKLYLERPGGLWRLDAATGAQERVLASTAADGARMDFDVAPATERVVFTRVQGVRSSLWTCGPDGADLRPVTVASAGHAGGAGSAEIGDVLIGGAKWLDAHGSRLVFSTAQGSASDLWSVEPSGRERVRLTFGSGVERLGDVALDGSALTFFEQRDASTLWLLPPGRGSRPRRLTADNALDFWPTADDRGDVVFQRADPATPDSLLHGARLMRLRPGSGPDVAVTPLAARGGEAFVSPDGRFVAFVRRDLAASTGQLWIADQRTEHVWRAATDVLLPSLHVFPLDGRDRMMAWSRSGPTLYWFRRQGAERALCSWQTGAVTIDVLAADDAAAVRDLHVSPDDRWLAYLRSVPGSPRRHELRLYDLDSSFRRHDLPIPASANSERLSLVGWIDGYTLLLAGARDTPDGSMRLCRLGVDGTAAEVDVVDRVVGSPRLDAPHNLLVARADDDGVQNIYALNLHTRRLERLTDNEAQGVGFAGITPRSDGSILFVQQERNESVWFVRIEGSIAIERSGSWLRRIKSPIS